jgi:hypothetical protein
MFQPPFFMKKRLFFDGLQKPKRSTFDKIESRQHRQTKAGGFFWEK